MSNGGRDWGANWEIALPDCDYPLALRRSQTRIAAALNTSADVNEIERLINEIESRNCWRSIRSAPSLSLAHLTGS
jgi:hypothetical protein